MQLLVSGYGGASGDTAGIYDFSEKRYLWRSGIASISYMCSSAGGRHIFGAGEHSGHGFVYMFVQDTGTYRLSDTLEIPGGALCHIAYSGKHGILTGACYETGDIFSVAAGEGKFGKMHSYIRQGGDAGPSRAHCTVFSPDERYLYSANIAQDKVYIYELTGGVLRGQGFIALVKGAGPRHILALENIIYVITEYSSEIITLRKDVIPERPGTPHAGAAEPTLPHAVTTCVSTLPDGFNGKSTCSTLCMSKAGYMYAANRGADTIAVFKCGTGGGLEKIHDCPCGGSCPRHIALVDEHTLAVANQSSGNIVLMKIEKDGSLGEIISELPFESAAFAGKA